MPLIHANELEKHQIKVEFDGMKSARGVLEGHWSEVAEIGSPRDDVFQQQTITEGQKMRNRQYDELAETTLDRATSFFGSITTPANQRWHALRTTNIELNKIRDVSIFFEQTRDILFANRYSPRANFGSQKYESDRSLLGFGNGILFTGSNLFGINRSPLWYKAIHLSQIYFTENEMGLVDKATRIVKMTGRQIEAEYGKDQIDPAMMELFGRDQEREFEILHAVKPNPNFDPDSDNREKKKYMSRHFFLGFDNEHYLRTGGFDTFPFHITRDSHLPGENYGRGTLQKILPAIKSRNQMKRTNIRIGHQIVDPAILLRDGSSIDIADLRPGHAVVGGLSADGTPAMAPWPSNGNYEISIEMLDREKQTIEQAFLLDLFVTALDRPGRDRITATEILARSQEQGRLATPLVTRLETEGLGPMIEREIDLLARAGMLPEMPGELIEAQGEFEIEFTSPLSLAQKADEAIGADNLVRSLTEVAQFKPEIMDYLNDGEYARLKRTTEGVSALILNSQEDVDEIREARAQAEAATGVAEQAAGVGRGVLDLVKAEQLVTEGADAV